MRTILKVESISKQYRLGVVGRKNLQEDLSRWWYGLRGVEDPNLKVDHEPKIPFHTNADYVWALKDVSFELKQGEVLGIVGNNGAGKSTLLKLLSRITTPTTGRIRSRGSIASLLEVGTGFHPELTGRENIFLSGTILGMSKKEVRQRLKEIISFSGCEPFIDTPFKRYSSGMRVRLGFAVAAHLNSRILIIDEVLAVGDAAFQKRALQKMRELTKDSDRAILFVSHNMESILSLCDRVIYLQEGKIVKTGEPCEVVDFYRQSRDSAGISSSTRS